MIGEALFKIRKFIESHDADPETLEAWEQLRDWITKTIGLVMRAGGQGNEKE